MKHRTVFSVLSLSFVALSAAHAQQADDGPALYQQYCAQCHGANLGGGNAQSMIDGVWQFGAGRGYITRNIKHGITHLGMPAYESTLTDAQIGQIVAFIQSKEAEAGAVKPPAPEQLQTHDYHVRVETFAEGLDVPWGIAFPDANTALITERRGTLRVVRDGALDSRPVANTPRVLAEGQGGLMEVAIDPDYSNNGWIYLSYSEGLDPAPGETRVNAMTAIVRGRIRDHAWVDEQTVFRAPAETYLATRHHYGNRIAFGPEGHLFFSIGDRGLQQHAQDLSRPNGKIHRVWPDGRIPEDNPFVDTPGAIPSIYAYGNRNPQGLTVRPLDGRLWAAEHGPMGGDELNVIEAGKNYGWPVITYGRNYNGAPVSDRTHADGMEQPALYWLPSIAVGGVEAYTGAQFPKWENALLVTALRFEEVRLVRVHENRVLHEEVILKNAGRVRTAVPGPDGAIYVVTNEPDAVLRLSYIADRTY